MRTPIDWVKRLVSSLGERQAPMIQLFTPQAATHSRPATRLLVAGLTIGALGGFGLLALGALGVLVFALGALYFLLTEVLGLRLDVDPEAFIREAQRYAQQATPRN
jgi:hypothetical protein